MICEKIVTISLIFFLSHLLECHSISSSSTELEVFVQPFTVYMLAPRLEVLPLLEVSSPSWLRQKKVDQAGTDQLGQIFLATASNVSLLPTKLEMFKHLGALRGPKLEGIAKAGSFSIYSYA